LLGTVTAIYNVGCFLGSILAYWLGEKLGRKNTILVGTTIMAIGAILQTASYSLGQMMAGRIIAGLGNGLNTSTAPIWQTGEQGLKIKILSLTRADSAIETSKVQWRGKLVVVEMILNIAGFSLSNWVNYGFSFAKGPISWRFPLAFQFVFIIILFLTTPWLPESPRYDICPVVVIYDAKHDIDG
jgi:MFS family permease